MPRNLIAITPFTVRNDWLKVNAMREAAAKKREDYEIMRRFLIAQGRRDLLPEGDRYRRGKPLPL